MQASTPLKRWATPVRELISAERFAAISATVIDNNQNLDQATAEQIVEEALKFVATCATRPEERLRPSRVVDEGWHALILHTATYAELCRSLGRFVHHARKAQLATPDPGGPLLST
ncbi:hypothetical protein C9F11_32740 [Streptomyces sp. YIM 121038]|uniref:hypothetical protein n=1 Tax=Streptomyces sp. YIM 121038 TaxID=2136401 RepID=UPI001110399B|nr:hypothetical protein [Streptomyces sp. YIM 121038]QCX80133.1 hypothetical protein C9F11_32740 [Streptomyces sp. YIM 121038]